MSRTPAIIDIFRTVVLVALVFFISLLIDVTIFGIVLTTVLFYAFLHYFKKSKVLQRQLADSNATKPDSQSTNPPSDGVPAPPSTDA